MNSLDRKRDDLLVWFRPFQSCVVAFSGGLDSSVVAKAAALSLGDEAVAVMAESASSLGHEVNEAKAVAVAIPIRFVVFESHEMQDESYTVNDKERCYYCKKIRFNALIEYAKEQNKDMVVDGSNADDSDDYRPGRRAVEETGVRSPLAELGITKVEVRELARNWNLPNSEKPASPCLSTRIAYGLNITDERLRQIEAAEEFLVSLGCSPLRVRLHPGRLARIEVTQEQINRLLDENLRKAIVAKFKSLGFDFVSLDLEGFRSGNMNKFDRIE